MFSILIADDHVVVRRGLRVLLGNGHNWKVVAEAATGREAVAQALALRPHVAILDIRMPELNGLDACRVMTKALPQTRILIVTVPPAPDLIARIVRAGARGYLLQSGPEGHLIAAVDALVHNQTFFPASASGTASQGLRLDREDGDESALSMRETEIVQLVVEGKSNKEAAAILGISTRTAENHRARVMHKLGFHSLSELVRYAIRNKMTEA